jgi:non-heme chloroperoxidase
MLSPRILAAALAAATTAPAAAAWYVNRRMERAPKRYNDNWLRPIEGCQHRIDTADGASIATVEVGTGPPVLVVHGLRANRDFWAPVTQSLLALGHRVIAMDQRGHGLSTTGSGGFTEEALADDLASVIVGLELTDVILVGHSMGGVAAQCLLIHRPELTGRISHVVFVASLCAAVPSLRHATRLDADHALMKFARRPQVARLACRASFGAGATSAEIDFALSTAENTTPAMIEAATHFLADLDLTDRLKAAPGTAAVNCTVVAGGSDRVTPPNAELVWHDDAGHQIPLERPLELAKLIHKMRTPAATVTR